MSDWSRGTLEGANGSTYTWTVLANNADRTSYTLTVYEDDVEVYTESFPNGVSKMDIYHLGIDKVYELGGVKKNGGGNGSGNGNGNGVDHGQTNLANVAGYWTIGVAKGTAIVFVPIMVVSMAVGFMTRVVKMGTKMGGA